MVRDVQDPCFQPLLGLKNQYLACSHYPSKPTRRRAGSQTLPLPPNFLGALPLLPLRSPSWGGGSPGLISARCLLPRLRPASPCSDPR